jgi:hypothetical protein
MVVERKPCVRGKMSRHYPFSRQGVGINHTCCAVHCNCEYVPTEFVRDRKGRSFSVNVRTTRDVKSTGGEPVEFLADYGDDYLKVLECFTDKRMLMCPLKIIQLL